MSLRRLHLELDADKFDKKVVEIVGIYPVDFRLPGVSLGALRVLSEGRRR